MARRNRTHLTDVKRIQASVGAVGAEVASELAGLRVRYAPPLKAEELFLPVLTRKIINRFARKRVELHVAALGRMGSSLRAAQLLAQELAAQELRMAVAQYYQKVEAIRRGRRLRLDELLREYEDR